MEDVDPHSLRRHVFLRRVGPHVVVGLLGDDRQVVQETIKRGPGWGRKALRVGVEIRLGRAIDRGTRGVAHHKHHAGAKGTCTELQASHHAAFRMGAGIARIPQDEDVARHRVEDRPKAAVIHTKTMSLLSLQPRHPISSHFSS